MAKRRVALITIGDSRKEFYRTRLAIVEEETRKVVSALEKDFDVYTRDIVYDEKEAIEISEDIRREGIKAVLIFYPIWGTPSLSLRIAQATDAPVAILGNRRTDSSSLVVMLTAAGMLDQMGIKCSRIAGELSDPAVYKAVSDYIIAASLEDEVKKSSFCMLGGRSIGIGTTVADPSQWAKVFGVSFDHRDQYEIYYRAEAIDQERVDRHMKWWKDRVKCEFSGLFTPESLERQVRSYLAAKDIVEDGHYDFLGLKCQQEMSDLVFVNLPQVGDPVTAGEVFADVESVKAVADIYSPVSGVVTAINETLLDDPGAINADPYGSWFIEVGEATVGEDLLDAAAYTAFCEEEKKED